MGHQAVDGLLNLFQKGNHDLTVIHNKLEKDFAQVYPHNTNPMNLVARVKKIEDELSSLSQQCRELLAAKQDLIDKATTILVGNMSSLQRLQITTGIPVTDESDDSAYLNFHQIIEEWTIQMRSKTGKELFDFLTDDLKQDSKTENVNHLLFSAIVPGN